MAADRYATLNLPLVCETKWQPGDEVEGSLALSTPSFPSEESCKLEPSTLRGVPMADQHIMPPRRKSDSLVSPRTGENVSKWLIGQQNARFDNDQITDAEACGVESTRPGVVGPVPMALVPEPESPANGFMAQRSSSMEDQVAIQADMVQDLAHNLEIQARNHSQEISKLKNENANLIHQLVIANERIQLVRELGSFQYGPEVEEKPMNFIHKKNESFWKDIQDLYSWLSEDKNAADIHNQFPQLVPMLTNVQNKGFHLVQLVKDLADDFKAVDTALYSPDSSMVQSQKKRYERMENSEIDQAIKKKFPGLTLE